MIRGALAPCSKRVRFARYRYVPRGDSHDRSKDYNRIVGQFELVEGMKHATNLGVDKGNTGIICLHRFQAVDFISP